MEAIVSKEVEEIGDPQVRLEGYLDLIRKISEVYNVEPRSGYLRVVMEINGILEDKTFVNRPIAEIERELNRGKVIEIESTIRGSFMTGTRTWYMEGEGPLIETYHEVSLVCETISSEEIRNLKQRIEGLSGQYSISIGKREF